ncbi:MAG: PIN domain-containing protein [Candidatus Desulfofervidus sp.]|nr:PIN domain-containing protein [Candidatus Desulfofervidus sp.]
MIILDTDILIWVLRKNKEIKNKLIKATLETDGGLYITPIQIAEIYAGIRALEEKIIKKFLNSFNIIPIDVQIGELAGRFINQYRKSHSVEIADATIAAASIVNNYM